MVVVVKIIVVGSIVGIIVVFVEVVVFIVIVIVGIVIVITLALSREYCCSIDRIGNKSGSIRVICIVRVRVAC